MKRAPHVLALVTLVAAAVAFSAYAQEQEAEKPTLHQDVVPPEADEGRASTNMAGKSVFGARPAEGQNPSAFANGEKILPQPTREPTVKGKEPVLGLGGFAADRDTQTRPDRQTGADDTLQYVAVFNPSILPFKRMSAMDGVDRDFQLLTRDPTTLQELTVGGAPTADRDLFWGSLMIDLTPGRDIPIPSLAPDMRVLSYEVEPRAALIFSKDNADNFYVRTDETGVSGAHRLVFMADADAGYFAPSVPRRYRVSDVAKLAKPNMLVSLPPNVQEYAQRAHQRLGLTTGMSLDRALDTLTNYFRGFTPKDLPDSGENVFWDLFTHQAGVCRHRSYAFMITATGLGIPTRYVTNEAHAWVEVWVPSAEWMRIDLGGAALRMQVDNASDKSMYRPRGEDPFQSPPEYENNYTQLEGDIEGLTEEQKEEGRQTRRVVDTEIAETGFDPEAPTSDAVDTAPRIGPGKALAEMIESSSSNKTKTYIRITDSAEQAFRGSGLPVAGILTTEKDNDQTGIDGQRVDVFLVPMDGDGDDAILVGTTVTKLDGTFSTIVTMPTRVKVSDYYLYVTSPGDQRYGAVSSE